MRLACHIHSICDECLIRKAGEEKRSEDLLVCRSKECTSEAPAPLPIYAFIDHANLWIEAKKLGSRHLQFDSQEDHRVRINYKRLREVIGGRRKIEGTVYASENSRRDLEMSLCNCDGFTLKTVERSAISGRQKRVDSMIIMDMLELKRTSGRSVIVLISGDCDFLDPVKSVLNDGWKVEILMWNHNTADELKTLEGSCTYKPLDEHWDDIVYKTNHIFSSDIDTITIHNPSLVLTFPRHKFQKGQHIDRTCPDWWKKLEQISMWPVQYKWLTDEARHLLLVFKELELCKTRMLAEKINKPSSEEFKLPDVERCEMYYDYKERLKRGPPTPVTPDLAWSKVTSRHTSRCSTPALTRQQVCCSGTNCELGKNCSYRHSEADREYFRRRGTKSNRKTRLCPRRRQCINPSRCDFTHGQYDRFCLKCHKTGHFKDVCPNAKCTHPQHTVSLAAKKLHLQRK